MIKNSKKKSTRLQSEKHKSFGTNQLLCSWPDGGYSNHPSPNYTVCNGGSHICCQGLLPGSVTGRESNERPHSCK